MQETLNRSIEELNEAKREAYSEIQHAARGLSITLATLDNYINRIPEIEKKLADISDRLSDIENNTRAFRNVKIR